ncbi:MAG: shikimate kinase [Methylophilaceae bacterium]
MVSKIILVGMMGAGKTTIGKLLSNKLGYDFVDLDKIIEEKSGVKINTIFEIEGEAGFREREFQVLRDSIKKEKVIISTGGGIVTNDKSRAQLIKHNVFIIYLKANLETLFSRLKNDNSRPILNVDNKEQMIERILHEREPQYQDLADMTVDTTYIKTNDVVKLIIKKMDVI